MIIDIKKLFIESFSLYYGMSFEFFITWDF